VILLDVIMIPARLNHQYTRHRMAFIAFDESRNSQNHILILERY